MSAVRDMCEPRQPLVIHTRFIVDRILKARLQPKITLAYRIEWKKHRFTSAALLKHYCGQIRSSRRRHYWCRRCKRCSCPPPIPAALWHQLLALWRASGWRSTHNFYVLWSERRRTGQARPEPPLRHARTRVPFHEAIVGTDRQHIRTLISGRIAIVNELFIWNGFLDAVLEFKFAFVAIVVAQIVGTVIVTAFGRWKARRHANTNGGPDASWPGVLSRWCRFPRHGPYGAACQQALLLRIGLLLLFKGLGVYLGGRSRLRGRRHCNSRLVHAACCRVVRSCRRLPGSDIFRGLRHGTDAGIARVRWSVPSERPI